MKCVKPELTLDRPATYEIKIPGHLNGRWTEWNGTMTSTVATYADGRPFTTLTCVIDRAALQGLLRLLYALGLPSIFVNYIRNSAECPPAAVQ